MSNYNKVILDNLYRQYLYTNLCKLLVGKGQLWQELFGNINEKFINEILNIKTCSFEALKNFWGNFFKLSNIIGDYELDIGDYRKLILFRAFGSIWKGDIISLNQFLYSLYQEIGSITIKDSLNMSSIVMFSSFEFKDWEKYVLTKTDILRRPAGVFTDIIFIEVKNKYFGFGNYGDTEIKDITRGFNTYKYDIWEVASFLSYNE